MKKLFLALAFIGFVTFGALGVQDLMASSYAVEMVNFDKDPKKDGEKKSKDSKATTEMKAESTTSAKDASCSSSCASSCASKSSASCCSKDATSCSKECPDKK